MTPVSVDQNTGQIQQQATGTTSANLSRTELNVLQTMIAVIIVFIICWAPSSLAGILQSLSVWLLINFFAQVKNKL